MHQPPCTAQPETNCKKCPLKGRLMCRYARHDTMHFFMVILPFFVIAIAGVIHSGYGWWLTGWLAFLLFFFFVWEARILCSHCPNWAGEGRVLRCHANYGVLKMWAYRPGPMNQWEQAQFLIAALLLLAYPLVFLVLGKQYLLAVSGAVAAGSGAYLLHRNICSRCINFSCPLNNVTAELREQFFARNPAIAKAWKK